MNVYMSFPWNIPHYHHVYIPPMYIVGCLFIVLCLYGYFVWIGQSTFWTHQPLCSHHTYPWKSDASCFELIHSQYPPHQEWHKKWMKEGVTIQLVSSLSHISKQMKDSFYPIYRDISFEPHVLIHDDAITNIQCFEMVHENGTLIGCFAIIPSSVSIETDKSQHISIIDLFWICPQQRGKGYAQMAMAFIANRSSQIGDGASCITFTKENYMLSSPYHRAVNQMMISVDTFRENKNVNREHSWIVIDNPSYQLCRGIVKGHVYEFPCEQVYDSFVKHRIRLLYNTQTQNWVICMDRGYRRFGKIVFDVHLFHRTFDSQWNASEIWEAFLATENFNKTKVDTYLCVPSLFCETFPEERSSFREVSCGVTYEYTYNCVVRPHLVSFLA